MPQSLSLVYVHIVFGTKCRKHWPALNEKHLPRVNAFIAGVFRNHGCVPLAVNGYANHVHPLINQARTVALSKVVGEAKAASSKWIRSEFEGCKDFQWQCGYAAFSVSPRHIVEAKRYVANQEARHKTLPFEDELTQLLRASGILYDERFLWD